MDRVKNIVGGKVRRRRQKLMLSHEELSQRLAALGVIISTVRIMAIERREVPVYDSEVAALAESLEVTVHWLVTGREFRERQQQARAQ
ncbi:MAG TPA: hypothetical protein PLE77_04775 [Kiritimatiellia bacterium]|nr:hypothetical protein [Kiritimatiellia bacterium]